MAAARLAMRQRGPLCGNVCCKDCSKCGTVCGQGLLGKITRQQHVLPVSGRPPPHQTVHIIAIDDLLARMPAILISDGLLGRHPSTAHASSAASADR